MALQPAEGAALAGLAAATVAARLAGRPVPDAVPSLPALTAPGACFVTLETVGRDGAGRLRGCVGTIEPARPLYLDAIRNAGRAMADPRLPAVTRDEWPHLDVTVSVLTPGGALPATSRAALVSALRPGIDGLLIADGTRRATFLPAVWAKAGPPERFVAALLAKGGWPADEWPDGLAASRYTATEYHDRAPRPPL